MQGLRRDKKNRPSRLALGGFLFALSFPVAVKAQPPDLWSVQWRNGNQAFERLKDKEGAVRSFFQMLGNVAYHFENDSDVTLIPFAAYSHYQSDEAIPFNYVAHRWMDMNGDGSEELLIENDVSGRGGLALNIVFQKADGYIWQSISLERGNIFIGNPIQDIDGDGRREILVEERISAYSGWQPPEVNLVIRGLQAGQYVDVTDKFPTYYQRWREGYLEWKKEH